MATKKHIGLDKDGVAVWQISWVESGRRKKKNFHGTEKSAEKLREQKEVQDAAVKLGLIHKSDIKPITLLDLGNKYFKENVREISYNTYNRYMDAWKSLMKHFGEMAESGSVEIESLKRSLIRTREKSGINIDLRAQRAIYNWAFRGKLVESVPDFSLYKTEEKEKNILSESQVVALLNCETSEENIRLLKFYLNTGARKSEPLGINFTWDDVNFDRSLIAMRRKGNKKNWVPANGIVMGILMEWKTEGRSTPIPFTETYVRKRLKEIRDISGIHFTPHDLRRTSGYILYKAGKSIYEISKWLGHSSVKTTERWYMDILDQDKVELAESMESAFQKLSCKV